MPITKDLSKFYAFREKLPSFLVKVYYRVSPYLVSVVNYSNSKYRVRRVFDIIERHL